MKFKFSSHSNVGLKRTENEDALGVYEFDEGLLVIVCDGLGGNKAGEVASQLAVEIIHNSFINSRKNDYFERIKDAILEANKIIKAKSESNSEYTGMATTAEILFINDNSAYWGHIGDSRIYNYRQGKLKQLTKDHSFIQNLIDEGHITLKEAENHPNRNIIMRAVGDTEEIEIDFSKIKIAVNEKDRFFICTDGVTVVVSDTELQEILSEDNFDIIKESINKLIESRGAPDNFSYVIVEKIE